MKTSHRAQTALLLRISSPSPIASDSVRSSNMAALRRALMTARHAVRPNHYNSVSLTAPSQSRYRTEISAFSRYISSDIQSFNIDLSNEESKRQTVNRLLYRSRQRGYLELDLVLGSWVEDNVSSMDESRIKALIDVLNIENPELWKWLTGQEQAPENLNNNPVFSAVRDKVMGNLDSHASPATRATPGKPWVRGWDDFKKGKDSPIHGNQ